MTFTESFRMERVYFEKLKSNITDIKNLLAAGNTEDARILLENSVDLDGAVLLLYRNLGECWAELADQIKKTREELDALKEATEAYHDELNEKIDDVNFVLLRLINALEARVENLETRVTALEECCEEVQEALENKQDKLTPGVGIEISEENVIDSTILSAFKNGALSGYNAYETNILERVDNAVYSILQYTTKISATGAVIKSLFATSKGVRITPSIQISATFINNLMNVGDVLMYYLTNIKCNYGKVFVNSIEAVRFASKTADNIVFPAALNSPFEIIGIPNFLETLNDSTTYDLTFSYEITPILNGKMIIVNGSDYSVTDPSNYSVSQHAGYRRLY